ncbi:hypothetical protein PF002_g30735 [Phytophthora fragariae]|uniref:Secreted protein n=1 Tax=Phytophthora fragariae TaxID=53985 RepID=A0A6A3DVW3_9STRA|nr:hypothetical protein PF003_g503 [Phytophthora fragariae]KAE8921858.1 hypothetical protein PF009_g27867 [Phytophthora fragariae]KAE9167980.1 hypothetical protein PF002_g30735 [Phytophthora fragariae]
MGRKFLLSLTVLKKTCACGTLSSLDGEVSGRACSYKYGPVLDFNGALRSRRSSLPWNWAWAQRTGWRLGLGRRRAGINSQWFRGSTRSGGRRPLPSGRNFTVGFTSRVAHCAAPAWVCTISIDSSCVVYPVEGRVGPKVSRGVRSAGHTRRVMNVV